MPSVRLAQFLVLSSCVAFVSLGCETVRRSPEAWWITQPEQEPVAEIWEPSQVGSEATSPAPLAQPHAHDTGDRVERVVYNVIREPRDVTTERLLFPAIVFDEGSAELDGEGELQVRQAAAALRRARGYNVVVEGHVDSDEVDRLSGRRPLDTRRAEVVRDKLVNNGVASDRLTVSALAASEPLSTAGSPFARALNRRVAFQMIPASLNMDPAPPEDDPMPDVAPGVQVVTVEKTVILPIPNLVFVDRLVFPNILFDYDKAFLREEALVRTERAAAALSAIDGVASVTVVGHCDHLGSDEYNDSLAARRAEAVRNRLVANGLAPEAVSADARGKRQPIAANESPEGRQLNRRVEFHIEYAD